MRRASRSGGPSSKPSGGGYLRGQRVLQAVPGASATTDDLGRYRLHSLPAGTVLLRASTSYRGAAAVEDDGGLVVFHVPAYYPARSMSPGAGPCAGSGQVTSAGDFALGASPGTRLTGRVIRSSGSPPQAGEITLLQFADQAYDRPVGGPDIARLGKDGAFEIAGSHQGSICCRCRLPRSSSGPTGGRRVPGDARVRIRAGASHGDGRSRRARAHCHVERRLRPRADCLRQRCDAALRPEQRVGHRAPDRTPPVPLTPAGGRAACGATGHSRSPACSAPVSSARRSLSAGP